MYIQLQADTQEIIDEAKPMICFFCVPKDTENVRANIRGLITQLFKARNYEGPGRYKYTANSLAGIEVHFMCQELLERLVKSVEEIEYTNKAHLAQLRGDKKVKWFIDKPVAPTTETPNPQITVASDSVFQVSSLLENSNITEIMSIAFLDDGTIGLPDLNPFNLESKIDDIRSDIKEAKGHFTGSFTSLIEWFAGSFRGGLFSDINPFGKESFFDRFSRTFNLPFIGGGITTTFWELHHKAFMQSDTVAHDNSWLAKLGDISNISGWLTADDGRLKLFFENITQIKDYLDYHLGEVQYGIKHFFNIFAVPTRISDTDPDIKGHKIYKEWPKPNTETYTDLLQDSVFQHTQDSLGRGFNFYDWLAMWIKPHGDNWQGLGYNNPNTNMKGHELVTGSNEQLDTLIERFSLAFLQTSNTTSILGKIRDILETGLLFSPGLGLLTLINNSLQSIHGVLDIDLGWSARSLDEIAAKDCCEGSNTNGSTTVTNPDGSQTTTPNEPTYPPIDPNDPDGPTKEPYPKSRPDTSGSNKDGVCGFLWYWLNQVADFLEYLFNVLNPLFWLFKIAGYSGISGKIDELSYLSYYLAKIPSQRLRSFAQGFFTFLSKNADNTNVVRWVLDTLPGTIRAYADDVACGANGQPEPSANFNADDAIGSLIEMIEEQIPTPDDIVFGLVGQAAYIVLDYFMSDTDLADYAQYCPCPSGGENWAGTWNSFGTLTLVQNGNSVTGTYATGTTTLTITGTANGKSLTGTWIDTQFNPDHEGTITWQMRAEDWNAWTGTYTSNASSGGAWNGTRIS